MRILAVIPCYNEEKNLARTVERLRETALRPGDEMDFIIVDDGSRDGTRKLCAEKGYPAVSLPFNLGLACAVQTGVRYARRMDYDMALQYDGDGQHDPAYIPGMIDLMRETNSDIVIGSRYLRTAGGKPGGAARGGVRGAGGLLLRAAVRIAAGRTLTDPTSGMRLFNRKMIAEFAGRMNYGPEPDTLAYLLSRGVRVRETPVAMRRRETGRSYLNGINAAGYMLRMFVSILIISWVRVREGEPRGKRRNGG